MIAVDDTGPVADMTELGSACAMEESGSIASPRMAVTSEESGPEDVEEKAAWAEEEALDCVKVPRRRKIAEGLSFESLSRKSRSLLLRY